LWTRINERINEGIKQRIAGVVNKNNKTQSQLQSTARLVSESRNDGSTKKTTGPETTGVPNNKGHQRSW
jgi:hypothetical protein